MKRLTQYLTFFATFFAAATMTAPAFCAGVTLVNQSTVLTSGGFPYVISQSGSYQLSSNLIVPCATELTGISITASYVTLDMDGFTLSCQTTPNAATGISITGIGVTIMNGIITGFGAAHRFADTPPTGSAIFVQPSGLGQEKIDHVRIDQCGYGISESGSVVEVTDSSVTNSVGQAILSYGVLRLVNSTIYDNLGGGISMNFGLVTGNIILGNGIYGVQVSTSATITNNQIGAGTAGVACVAGASSIGLGMNTFTLDGQDTTGFCVSMKNNVSGTGVAF